MSSYRQILYHIVFGTKGSKPTLSPKHIHELFAYISGIIKNKKCHLYRINGMQNHLHILCDLHPNIALADYMRDIKTSTSFWLKQHKGFMNFKGWADGYAALTYSFKEKDKIINYIKNQQSHHKKESFHDELRKILEEAGVQINEQFFP
ncbi:MAG: IS200/IS605 family transposase [Bacteroidales bacterium]|nr:IS200/IS605 family transposase [Bacteroidales bacterium]